MSEETYQRWEAGALRKEIRNRGICRGNFNQLKNNQLRAILTEFDVRGFDAAKAMLEDLMKFPSPFGTDNEVKPAPPKEAAIPDARPAAPSGAPPSSAPTSKFPSPFGTDGEAAASASEAVPVKPEPDLSNVKIKVPPADSPEWSNPKPNGKRGLTPEDAKHPVLGPMLQGFCAAAMGLLPDVQVTPEELLTNRVEVREVKIEVVKEVPVPAKPAWQLPGGSVEYVRPSYWDKVNKLVDLGFAVCLVGPSGCGKTYFWREVARVRKYGYWYNDCGIETTAGEIIGGIGLEGGNTKFKPGKLTQAMQFRHENDLYVDETKMYADQWQDANAEEAESVVVSGALYRLGEMDFLNPGIAGRLHGVLDRMKDGRRRLQVNDRTIMSAPNFIVGADANTTGRAADRNYQGTNRQNEAFINRWKIVRVDYENEGHILKAYKIELATARKMVKFAKHIREQLANFGIPFVYTTRDLTDAALLINNGVDIVDAVSMPFEKLTIAEIAKLGGDGSTNSLFAKWDK